MTSEQFHTFIRNMYSRYNEMRMKQIKESLAKRGYEFDNDIEFKKFIKEHCTIFKLPNNQKILTVDNISCCTWFDNVSIKEKEKSIIVKWGE